MAGGQCWYCGGYEKGQSADKSISFIKSGFNCVRQMCGYEPVKCAFPSQSRGRRCVRSHVFYFFCILAPGKHFDIFTTFCMVIEVCTQSATWFNDFLSPSVFRQLYEKILSDVPDVCLDVGRTCGLNTRSGKCLLVTVDTRLPCFVRSQSSSVDALSLQFSLSLLH